MSELDENKIKAELNRQARARANEFQPDKMFKLNMEVLREVRPDIAKRVDDYGPPKRTKRVNTGRHGVFDIIDRGKWIHRTKNQHDPREEAVEYWSAVRQHYVESRCVAFFGIGCGHRLACLVARGPLERWVFTLIVEPEVEYFIHALHSYDWRQIFKIPTFHFLIGIPQSDLYAHLWSWGFTFNMMNCAYSIHRVIQENAYPLFHEYYNFAQEKFEECIAQCVRLYGNDPVDGLIGEDNMFANVENIIKHPGVKQLFTKFKGVPAICVASGPSLNDSIDLLRKAKGKALIICADGSFKSLLRKGIYPDMVTTQERGPTHMRLFCVNKDCHSCDPRVIEKCQITNFSANLQLPRERVEKLKDVWVAGCPVQDPQCYQMYPGPHLIVYRTLKHFDWLEIDRGAQNSGSSVAHLSFLLAASFGCDPIILLGQDLALGPEGATHESGATEVSRSFVDNYMRPGGGGILQVPGNNGKPVKTHHKLLDFILTFDTYTTTYKGTVINAIDPNKGARIQNTTVMPFPEVLEKHLQKDYDITNMIRQGAALPDTAERQKHYEHLSLKFGTDIPNLHEIKQAMADKVRDMDEFLKKTPENKADTITEDQWMEIMKELDTFGQELLHPDQVGGQIVTHVIQSTMIRCTCQMFGLYKDYSLKRHIAHHKVYALRREMFDLFSKMMDNIISMMDRHSERIKKLAGKGTEPTLDVPPTTAS